MSTFHYVCDPWEYERIAIPENITCDGRFVCPLTGVSVKEESIAEYALIQKFVRKLGYDISLKEAEYLWSTYCQNHFCENWISFEPDDIQFIETVRQELKIGV